MSAGNQCRIFVGGLKSNITKEDLEQEFTRFGRLRDVWVAHNPPGFAFVEYHEEKDATACLSGMNGAKIQDCQIRVEVVKHKPRGGDYGGAGRGVGRGAVGRGSSFPSVYGASGYTPSDYPAALPRYEDYYRDEYRRYARPYENGAAAYGRRTPPGYRSRSPVGASRTPPPPIGRGREYMPRDYPAARGYAPPEYPPAPPKV
ncbi:PREDICTED: RNA-binding protein 1-like isoform X2 [Priapulus caudatus]|nr:PREDICTED: RNA-binding protein 1-like isoform X2 [Priapulus caudatus]